VEKVKVPLVVVVYDCVFVECAVRLLKEITLKNGWVDVKICNALFVKGNTEEL
jgi:hypothetical protein